MEIRQLNDGALLLQCDGLIKEELSELMAVDLVFALGAMVPEDPDYAKQLAILEYLVKAVNFYRESGHND